MLIKGEGIKLPVDIYRKGIHGIEHACRVFNLVQKLVELEELGSQSVNRQKKLGTVKL